MRCLCCGNEINETQRYCVKCGQNNESYVEEKSIEQVEVYHHSPNNSADSKYTMEFWDNVKKTGKEIAQNGRRELVEAKTTVSKVIGKIRGVSDEDPNVKLDDILRSSIDLYNDAYTMLNDAGVTLYNERTRSVDLIELIENLINSIANKPKEFDTAIAEIQVNKNKFKDVCDFTKEELETAKKTALGAGVGVTAGAAIVSVAPSVAMWVATTFGTASTGVAISSLSGAAATNAALAWLGGGAVVTGGGGIAAGNAFLALAGPIGWTIAGASILTSVVLFSKNKIKMNGKKKEEIEAVKENTASLKKTAADIQILLNEVVELRNALNRYYLDCVSLYNANFTALSYDRQMQLGALVNNTKALSASLGKTI